MSAHTPGPWTFELDVVDEGDINVFRDGPPEEGIPGRPICSVDVREVPEQTEMPSREEALANARLIAAAPELLRLLKKASGAVDEIHAQEIGCPDCTSPREMDGELPCDFSKAIDAAIAKAEGR